jgi:hypothetical protein
VKNISKDRKEKKQSSLAIVAHAKIQISLNNLCLQ